MADFKISAQLKQKGDIIVLTDAPARYQCQLTGYLSEKRVGFPGFLLTNAKPSPQNSAIRGCFCSWNVAFRYLLHHRDEMNNSDFERIQSWLFETALQGLSEDNKRMFQPTPAIGMMKLHGGTLSAEEYVNSVPFFANHSINLRDELESLNAKKDAPESAKEPVADWRSSILQISKGNPDAYSSFTVGLIPSLSFWSVLGTNGNDAGWQAACRELGARVPINDHLDVDIRSAPAKLGKRQATLVAKWHPLVGERPDGGSEPAGKKRSDPEGSSKPKEKKARTRKPAGKSTPAVVQ